MKKIVYTQRVEVIEGYGERRDCADQKIAKFIYACGFLPIPIVNIPDIVLTFVDDVMPDGILFSGGNDLAAYGGDAPERDETERILLECAVQKHIPLFGICRGMQMIADYYGMKLEKINAHIGCLHQIGGLISRDAVNSYHGWGIKEIASPLVAVSKSMDGIVEALKHDRHRIAAIMWHPERELVFSNDDIKLIADFFNRGAFA